MQEYQPPNIFLVYKMGSDMREPKSFHVEQLKYYMAMLDVPQGCIMYQLLLHYGGTPFKAFIITMNAQERNSCGGVLTSLNWRETTQ